LPFFDPAKIKLSDAQELISTPIPEGAFIIEPRILPKGGKMLFGAPTKTGKTFVAINLVKNLLLGTHPWGNKEWSCKPGNKVLFIEREVGPWGMGERLRNIFADVPEEIQKEFKIISMPLGLTFSSHDCVLYLKQLCADLGIDVLVLDPLNKLSHFNENDSSDILKLIDALDTVSDGRVATIYSHHFGKPMRGREAQDWDKLDHYNFRGSSRFVDDADALLTMWRDPGKLVATHDSWKLQVRLTLRHGPSPDDFMFYVNEHNNGAVEYRQGSVEREEPKQEKPKWGGKYII
jgi:hypothetical protein